MVVSRIGTAGAEVYKWVDERGNTHYGERPPQNSDVGEVTIRKGPSGPDPILERQRERQRKLLDVMQQEREEKKEKKQKSREEREQQQRRCFRARDRLKQYRRAGLLYEYDKQGNKTFLDDMEREKAIKQAENDVSRYCR